MSHMRVMMGDGSLQGIGLETITDGLSYNWSDENPPHVPATDADLTRDYDGTEVVVELVPGNVDEFDERLGETIAQVNGNGRVIVEFEGMNQLTRFRKIGSGSDPTYAFGFWYPRLRGLLGHDAIVQMNANSMSAEQLDRMKVMTQASFYPLQQGFARIDATPASPYRVSGVTFQAADQQLLTSVSSDFSPTVYTPTPAPHTGLLLYSDTTLAGTMSYTQFLAAGRGIQSQPPFECANIHTGKGYQKWSHINVDGRRAASIDPARPRRCGVFLINSEYDHMIEDSWMHHSAISRYAANDQNSNIAGLYGIQRSKLERITDTRNTDPAMNNGNSLGGVTNATPFGWESTNGTIVVKNNIIIQDNPNPVSGTGQIPMMFQLTLPGDVRNPQGGRFQAIDNQYIWTPFPWLNGYAGFRISQSSYWWTDGFNTTITVMNDGVRKAPLVVPSNVTWPPTEAWLTSQGATPETHYLIRGTS